LEYRGGIRNGLYEGQGKLNYVNGNLEYQGGFSEGGPDGETCLIFYDNKKYKYRGGMVKGHYEGYGVFWNPSGDCVYKGMFKNGVSLDGDALVKIRDLDRKHAGHRDFHHSNNILFDTNAKRQDSESSDSNIDGTKGEFSSVMKPGKRAWNQEGLESYQSKYNYLYDRGKSQKKGENYIPFPVTYNFDTHESDHFYKPIGANFKSHSSEYEAKPDPGNDWHESNSVYHFIPPPEGLTYFFKKFTPTDRDH
jgi:hypothetical protein